LILNDLVQLVIILWVLSEILLSIFLRARGGSGGDQVQDRSSFFVLYGGIFVGVALAIIIRNKGPVWAHIDLNFYLLNVLALVFLLGGMAWRTWAILTLGRFFTTNVAVRSGHRVIRQGPYRWMRHPSYTGGLTTFFGLGLALANWLSLVVLMVMMVTVYIYRMNVEEKVLIAALGDEYLEYSRQTKRLIPGIY
jgi:protein-S-isoprenylcysteine O-methyltransferase Ste14